VVERLGGNKFGLWAGRHSKAVNSEEVNSEEKQKQILPLRGRMTTRKAKAKAKALTRRARRLRRGSDVRDG
jgi:hypothetical protein